MEKNEITLSFDGENLEALPEPLREYLDAKTAPARLRRPTRPSPSRAVSKPAAGPAEQETEGSV